MTYILSLTQAGGLTLKPIGVVSAKTRTQLLEKLDITPREVTLYGHEGGIEAWVSGKTMACVKPDLNAGKKYLVVVDVIPRLK